MGLLGDCLYKRLAEPTCQTNKQTHQRVVCGHTGSQTVTELETGVVIQLIYPAENDLTRAFSFTTGYKQVRLNTKK